MFLLPCRPIQQAHTQVSFDSTKSLEMKIPLPQSAQITPQTAKGKKAADKRLLWKRCSHNHKCIHKQRTADVKLSSAGLLIHKTQTVVITSQLTQYSSWGICHPLTGLALFTSEIMMARLLRANWKPNRQVLWEVTRNTPTEPQKEQSTLPTRHELGGSPRIEQWGLCKNNTVAKGLVSLILERKENFSMAECGNYCKC